jgi:hypothetical protein
MLAVIVDTKVLWKLVVASLAGGIGASLSFSLVILGATRFVDLRREGRSVSAGVFVALSVLAFAVFVAGVVYGVTVVSHKS